MFSSSLPFLSLLSFFSFVIPSIVEVHAAINVTVDNSDPGILYRPLGSWSLDDSYDSGATDHFTGDQDAWAAFNFTGIAVYYLVHLYPSSLPTGGMISLDGGPAVAVTMWNPDRDSYGRQWETVWSAANLTNTTHMLNVSWWPNQLNQFISLDTIMYTIDNETDATSAGSAQPTASGADFGSSTTSSSNNTVPIVVGVVLGLLFLIAAAAAVFFFLKLRKTKEAPTPYPPPLTKNVAPDTGSTYMAEPFPHPVRHSYVPPPPSSPGAVSSSNVHVTSTYSVVPTSSVRESLYGGNVVGQDSVYSAPVPDNMSSTGPQGSTLSRLLPQV